MTHVGLKLALPMTLHSQIFCLRPQVLGFQSGTTTSSLFGVRIKPRVSFMLGNHESHSPSPSLAFLLFDKEIFFLNIYIHFGSSPPQNTLKVGILYLSIAVHFINTCIDFFSDLSFLLKCSITDLHPSPQLILMCKRHVTKN